MKDKILVIGGYGKVGQVICKDLGSKFPGKVIAAGRNFEKAERFTQTTGENVIPLEFDLFANNAKNKILKQASIVVMCIDQSDTNFIKDCLINGIHYIDITASYSILSKIEALNYTAKESDATAVVSVGLSPGLTNLLVQHSKSYFDTIDKADISLMLGLGEKHGKAGIEWMIDNINASFEVVEDSRKKKVKTFEDGRKTTFPDNIKDRTVYRFNFAEQHILPKTLHIKSVSNRICFDSRFVTASFALLKKLGILNVLKVKLIRNATVRIFENVHLGSDLFSAKVEASGKKDGKATEFECSVIGKNESRITGKVAAILTEFMYTKEYPSGVYHIEQIVSCQDIIEQLPEDIKFYVNRKRT
ncbi:Saccharopine dehydrogenase [Salipaludibacillus neizhouensis]|uniref:Saccharopine dehydrogenase n=1 Tax=Salipaludibacillus neizhouensis TaxID=885475 RepID=A0A3A9KLS3_9BACI|nr:saccharopine dehydrogenase NADP-binding domain-containing protein [Salipaludibacillus neizhouensis]RKL65756.1 Saccharopine dehydrogenase [Salipaludibacillus neizhouensis]